APAHPRRGMAFADALFAGTATLEGVVAQRAPNLDTLLSIGAIDELVPVCDAPLGELMQAYPPDVLIDARMRKRSAIEDQRTLAPTVVGLGPGFDTRTNCHIAIETAWGECLGYVVREGRTAALEGEPRPLDGVGRERFVYAPTQGVWHTALQIGSRVTKGPSIGHVEGHQVVAPLDGFLRGLSHDGVAVAKRQKIVEIDPRDVPQVFGQGERPRAIAKGVLKALNLHGDAERQFFGFEREFEATLDCMPMSVRLKMDLCGIKLSLAQWRALPAEARRTTLDAQCESHVDVRRLRRFLEWWIREGGGTTPLQIQIDHSDWQVATRVPDQVNYVLASSGLPHLPQPAWARLDDLQRFALCKLTTKGQARTLPVALVEFGLA
ncbi:nitrate reductase associated protein, partial [Variovorax sp. WS11]